ncbi:hypothetical protein DAI22_01g107408 [Oryza sativa Japonica Group]|nr:hypothetical protein DAI22_01g107408 [Oryza sativa Japonica Group]KAF2949450.1 hypothetical protein DAI22_01g107408 [Oryza sativa Japonica Group]KAF2949451.1 hypothetical protein DAI22_01g107408 [Oryza sativa Japonica Group]
MGPKGAPPPYISLGRATLGQGDHLCVKSNAQDRLHLSTAPSSPPPFSRSHASPPLPNRAPLPNPNLSLSRGTTAVVAALDCRSSAVVASVVSPPPIPAPPPSPPPSTAATPPSPIVASVVAAALDCRRSAVVASVVAATLDCRRSAFVASVVSPPPIPAAGSPSTNPHHRRRIRRRPGFTSPFRHRTHTMIPGDGTGHGGLGGYSGPTSSRRLR